MNNNTNNKGDKNKSWQVARLNIFTYKKKLMFFQNDGKLFFQQLKLKTNCALNHYRTNFMKSST